MRAIRDCPVPRTVSVFSARFLRDVTASILATLVASLAFSHLAREPAPQVAGASAGKTEERLTWRTEDVPTRDTRIYDTVAMFRLPLATDWNWSEPAVARDPASADKVADLAPAKPVKTAAPLRLASASPARVPPSRPAGLAPSPAILAEPEAEPQPVRVFGWAVPGSDIIMSGRNALRTVASLGGQVASFGGSLAESVGIR